MQPRFVTRTHYQVDEPTFLNVLVTRCASPIRSDYIERVAARFVKEVKTRPSLGRATNVAAAKYLVDLGRALSLLNGNMVWTPLAHIVPLVCRTADDKLTLELNLKERVFFFRVLLESDGAALMFAARALLKYGELPAPGRSWVDFANEMARSIYEEYLSLATDLRLRTTLRQALQKRAKQPFRGKSGPHQSFVHVQALYRLGLASKSAEDHNRRYLLQVPSRGLELLASGLPDLAALETVFEKKHWPELAFTIFAEQAREATYMEIAQESSDDVLARFRDLYDRVMATAIPLCPIQTLIEAWQIEQICSGRQPRSFSETLREMRRWQEKWPRDVRFHVDRYGHPTYIKLSDVVRA